MKKILTITILVICSQLAVAQGLKFGVTGGLNINAARGNVPSGVRLGYSVGGTALYNFKESECTWYLGASLLLSQKGYKVNNVYSPNSDGTESLYKTHLDMTFLELPVVVGKNFAVGNNSSIFIEAGPYVSCALWGRTKTELDGHETNSSHHVFGDGGYKRIDYGLTFGIGANLSNKVRIKCNYELGLPNLIKNEKTYPGTEKPTYRNGNIAVSVSYMF